VRLEFALTATLLTACATAAPPRTAPAAAVVSSVDRLDAADAKLARFRERRTWPSPADRDAWTSNLAEAEDARRACDDPAAAADGLRRLEAVLPLLDAADTTFRLGERMRQSR
jgi:hypothetical protein